MTTFLQLGSLHYDCVLGKRILVDACWYSLYCLHNPLDIRYDIWVYLDIGYRYGFLVIR